MDSLDTVITGVFSMMTAFGTIMLQHYLQRRSNPATSTAQAHPGPSASNQQLPPSRVERARLGPSIALLAVGLVMGFLLISDGDVSPVAGPLSFITIVLGATVAAFSRRRPQSYVRCAIDSATFGASVSTGVIFVSGIPLSDWYSDVLLLAPLLILLFSFPTFLVSAFFIWISGRARA